VYLTILPRGAAIRQIIGNEISRVGTNLYS
jgi:hypothetical protein